MLITDVADSSRRDSPEATEDTLYRSRHHKRRLLEPAPVGEGSSHLVRLETKEPLTRWQASFSSVMAAQDAADRLAAVQNAALHAAQPSSLMRALDTVQAAQGASILVNQDTGHEIADGDEEQVPSNQQAFAPAPANPGVSAGLCDEPATVPSLEEYMNTAYDATYVETADLPHDIQNMLTAATTKFTNLYIRFLNDSEQEITVKKMTDQGIIIKTLRIKPPQFQGCNFEAFTKEIDERMKQKHEQYIMEQQLLICQARSELVQLEKAQLAAIEAEFTTGLDTYVAGVRERLQGTNPKLAALLGAFAAKAKRKFNAEVTIMMDREWLKKDSQRQKKEAERLAKEAAEQQKEAMDVDPSVRQIAAQEATKVIQTAVNAAIKEVCKNVNGNNNNRQNTNNNRQNNNNNNQNCQNNNQTRNFNNNHNNNWGWNNINYNNWGPKNGGRGPPGRGNGRGRGRGRGGRGGR